MQSHAYQEANREAEKRKGPCYYQLVSEELGFLHFLSPLHLHSCQHRLRSAEVLEGQLGVWGFFDAYSDVRAETMVRGKQKEK